MTGCRVDSCGRPIKAREMCAMHYMRERRTGDAGQTRGPGGRPRDPRRAMWAKVMGEEWSERTFSDFYIAVETLTEVGAVEPAINAATRPNGTLNVAKLSRLAGVAAMEYVITERFHRLDADSQVTRYPVTEQHDPPRPAGPNPRTASADTPDPGSSVCGRQRRPRPAPC